MSPSPGSRPRRLYAHRGAAIELPENTMEAFSRAMEIGADALEMDGHLSADGRVVISHDPTGERMCGMPVAIRASRLETIREWDAGAMFRDRDGVRSCAGHGMQMPTLDDVLTEFPDVVVNLDLKQERPSMVAETIAVVRRHDAESRVILASFSTSVMLAVRRAGYRGLTALPQSELIAFLALPRWLYRRAPWRGKAAQLPTTLGPFDVGHPYLIKKCHDVGVRADFWTINDPARAQELLERGADGIMTDDPAAMIDVFAPYRGNSRATL